MACLEAKLAYTHHTPGTNSRYRLVEQYSLVFTYSTQTMSLSVNFETSWVEI